MSQSFTHKKDVFWQKKLLKINGEKKKEKNLQGLITFCSLKKPSEKLHMVVLEPDFKSFPLIIIA